MKMSNLRDRVAKVNIIILLSTFVICLMVVLHIRATIGQEWEDHHKSVMVLVNQQIEESAFLPLLFFDNLDSLILSEGDMSTENITKYLETLRLTYSYFSEIHIVDNYGKIVNSVPEYASHIGDDVSNEPYFTTAEIGRINFSDVFISTLTDTPTLALTLRTEDYYLVAQVNLGAINEYFDSAKYFNEIDRIYLLDGQGKFIVNQDYNKVLYGDVYDKFFSFDMENNNSGYDRSEGWGYNRIEALDFFIVYEFTDGDAYGKLTNFSVMIILIFIMLSTFGLYNISRYGNDVNHQVNLLIKKAKDFMEGRKSDDEITKTLTFEEFVELDNSFENLYESLQERENKILNMNEDLEKQVQSRTSQLETTNQQLIEEIKVKKETEEELQHMYLNLDNQVKSRTEELEFLNNVLKSSVKEAEDANNAKSKFLSVMSHEMRTPLNGIIGFIQMLELEPMNETQEEIVGIIKNSSATLLNLINEILDLAKYESGKMVFEEITFNLGKIIGDCVAPFKTLVNYDSKIEFTDKYEGNMNVQIIGDPVKLTQLLTNLISNAVKFTERGYIKVHMNSFINGSKLKLLAEVKDSGIGMREEVRQYLFTPFYQADASITREFGGTGLGLTICKEIVEHYGGIIEVDSVEERGSIFRFSITYDIAMDNGNQLMDENSDSDDLKKLKGRVLIVEDNLVNQKLMVKFLDKHQVPHDVASNGREAVELCKINYYDMIFMDCQMPVMNGFDATRTIRADGYKGSIFAMTAYAANEDRKKALESGMDEFLTKPVDLNVIMTILGISKKQTERKKNEDDQSNDYLDLNVKSLMKKIEFDYDTCMDLMITFINQAKEAFEIIDDRMLDKDYEAVAKKLHQLKGAAGAVRLDRMRRDFEQAEEMVKDKEIAKCNLILSKLKQDPLIIGGGVR